MKALAYLPVVSLLTFAAGAIWAQQKPSSSPPAAGLETVQQTNQRLRLLVGTPASVPEAAEKYTLQPGDQIKVQVFDIPELSQQMRIDPSGYISMPLIPTPIRAAGLTAAALASRIADLLSSRGLVTHPQVSVYVESEQGEPITVIGAVERPMVYKAVRPTSLLEVLSAAGGLTDAAGYYVSITRAEKNGRDNVQRISLQQLIDQGDPKANVVLQGGDVVAVPKAGVIYVEGAVNRPGAFVIPNDIDQMTVLKALALAGGTATAAKPQDAVIIRRNAQGGKNQEITVNVSKILNRKTADVRLVPNDILLIPTSTGKRVLSRAIDAALGMGSSITVLRSTGY